MRRLPKGLERRQGFTLLEAVVVMVLIALVAGAAAQRLRPPSARVRLEIAARNFCATLRAARARAIATNSETSIVIDLARNAYASPVGAPGRFPPEALVTLNVAGAPQLTPSRGAIAFFPDGGSTGGDMTLQTPDARATIAVNWLTGEARCAVS
jgi:general secretion pathway protein H